MRRFLATPSLERGVTASAGALPISFTHSKRCLVQFSTPFRAPKAKGRRQRKPASVAGVGKVVPSSIAEPPAAEQPRRIDNVDDRPIPSIDVLEAVQEWVELRRRFHDTQQQGSSAASPTLSKQPSRTPLLSTPPGERIFLMALLGKDITVAERTALLSLVTKEPKQWRRLHTLFYPQALTATLHAQHLRGRSQEEMATAIQATFLPFEKWDFPGMDAVVQEPITAVAMLALIRLHRQVRQHDVDASHLHQCLFDAYTEAVGQQVAHGAVSEHRVALALRSAMDAYRFYIALGPRDEVQKKAAIAAAVSQDGAIIRGDKKSLRKAKAARKVEEERTEAVLDCVYSRILAPLLTQKPWEVAPSSRKKGAESSAAAAALMYAAVVVIGTKTATALHRGEDECAWQARQDSVLVRVKKTLDEHLAAVQPRGKAGASNRRCAEIFDDVLQCLAWSREVALVLPSAWTQSIDAQCRSVLGAICTSADTEERVALLEDLCTPMMASRLEVLEVGSPVYMQVATDIFTAAAAYLRRQGSTPALAALADRLTAASGASAQWRPDNSPVSLLCYCLMCAGYHPHSVLSGGLCLSLSPRDAVDVVRAANIFSFSSATIPLPVRTRVMVVNHTVSLLEQSRRDASRVVAGETNFENASMEVAGPSEAFSVQVSVRNGASCSVPPTLLGRPGMASAAAAQSANAATPTRRPPKRSTRKGGKKAGNSAPAPSRAGEGEAVSSSATLLTAVAYRQQLNYVMYVAANAVAECVLRGDVKGVDAIARALLPLLLQEGKEAALADMLALLVEDVRQRLREIGRGKHRRDGDSLPAGVGVVLTDTQEEALSVLPTLFLSRLAEVVLRLAPSGPGGAAASRVASAKGWEAPITASGEATAVVSWTDAGRQELQACITKATVASVLCGVSTSAAKQLIAVHNTAMKLEGAVPEGEAACLQAALAVTARLQYIFNQVEKQSLPATRHVKSNFSRYTSTVFHELVSLHLGPTSPIAVALRRPQLFLNESTKAEGRALVLAVVHLLYRLTAIYTVESEPATLRRFRIDVLDAALIALMQAEQSAVPHKGSARRKTGSLRLPLSTLSEVAVVVFMDETVHHVSHALVEGIVASAELCMNEKKTKEERPAGDDDGTVACALLCAASVLCLRGDDALTQGAMRLLELLESSLNMSQSLLVLQALRDMKSPLSTTPVLRLIQRLVKATQFPELRQTTPAAKRPPGMPTVPLLLNVMRALSATEAQLAAQRGDSLAAHHGTSQDGAIVEALLGALRGVPYGPLLTHLMENSYLMKRKKYTLRDCGVLVEIAAHLQGAAAAIQPSEGPRRNWTEAEAAVAERIPRMLAVYVLKLVQQPFDEHGIPQLLKGYAMLKDSTIQQQVMRAFIARTIRVSPHLQPRELVQCVEAYCAAAIDHEQLFGVLLARVADVQQRFSLALSLRLLRCGVANGSAKVRTICVTAVQPIFVSQVRLLLLSDPQLLVSVSSTAAEVFAVTRSCFPTDDISGQLLVNVARHQQSASYLVTLAALNLAAARGSADYDSIHTLADHCVSRLVPKCSTVEVAELFALLLVCGVRTQVVLDAIFKRISVVVVDADGFALARLAAALTKASVVVEAQAMEAICQRIVTLVSEVPATSSALKEKKSKPAAPLSSPAESVRSFPVTPSEAAVLLHLLHSGGDGRGSLPLRVSAADALFYYLDDLCEREEGAALWTHTTPQDVAHMLQACIDVSDTPKAHHALVEALANHLHRVYSDVGDIPPQGGESHTAPSDQRAPVRETLPDRWPADVAFYVTLASLLARLGLATHPLLPCLFEVLYRQRGHVMQRALLVKTTRQMLSMVGEEAHPELYRVIVKGDLL